MRDVRSSSGEGRTGCERRCRSTRVWGRKGGRLLGVWECGRGRRVRTMVSGRKGGTGWVGVVVGKGARCEGDRKGRHEVVNGRKVREARAGCGRKNTASDGHSALALCGPETSRSAPVWVGLSATVSLTTHESISRQLERQVPTRTRALTGSGHDEARITRTSVLGGRPGRISDFQTSNHPVSESEKNPIENPPTDVSQTIDNKSRTSRWEGTAQQD